MATNRLVLFFFFLLCLPDAFAQLQSGPMVGYSDMQEVMLWVQTQKPATVRIDYWEDTSPNNKKSTAEVRTEPLTAYVARLFAGPLKPGKKYEYEVYVDGKKISLKHPLRFQSQALWQHRTDPPPFRFAIGSCTYVGEEGYDRPGRPYGGQYGIFKAIQDKKPDFMVWGGDNVYYREPDWNTRSGMLHRYTHTRSLPEMQPLLGSTHNYAIWDDHDYGPNDSDRSYWLKQTAGEVFRLFWGNPNYIFDGPCTGTFFWNDAQFFLLDDRWFRAPNELTTEPRDYFGDAQIQWLLDALANSRATFKFIVTGGQVVNAAEVFENYSNYSTERSRFLQALDAAHVPGVVFLTGDRHSTALHILKRPKTYPLYDFTISPLTSGAATPLRVEYAVGTMDSSTVVTERNFATFDITGPLNNRKLTVMVFDVQGKELWRRELLATDLE
jgi:alkaline phosphatase D